MISLSPMGGDGGWQEPGLLQECFSSHSLNNINIFSLNNKTINFLIFLILFSGSVLLTPPI